MEGDNLDPWVMFFKTILDMECPPDLNTPTDDQNEIQRRDKSSPFSGKSRELQEKLLTGYSSSMDGNPSLVEDKVLTKTFSNSFSLKYSIPLLESHL